MDENQRTHQVEELAQKVFGCRDEALTFAGRYLQLEAAMKKLADLTSDFEISPLSNSKEGSKFYMKLRDLSGSCCSDRLDTGECPVEEDAIKLKIFRRNGPDKISLSQKIRSARLKLQLKRLHESILLQKIFTNELITSTILESLPVKDLLVCSVVNQHFLKLSRQVLHRSRITLVHIGGPNHYMQMRESFFIIQKSIHPFYNGLSITVHNCTCSSLNLNLEEEPLNFPANFKLRNLKLAFSSFHNSSIEFNILRNLLATSAQTLQTLSIRRLDDRPMANLNHIGNVANSPIAVIGNGLPNLTKISLVGRPRHRYMLLVNDFVRASPNLKFLEGEFSLNLLPTLQATNKSHILKEFHCTLREPKDLVACQNFLQDEPKFQKLVVKTFPELGPRPFNWNQIEETICRLYSSQKDFVKILEIDYFNLVHFLRPILPSLDGIKKIHIYFYHPKESREWDNLMKINFQVKFPQLKFIFIEVGSSCPVNLLYDHNVFQVVPYPHFVPYRKCETVTQLHLKFCTIFQSRSDSFEWMFPNVTYIRIDQHDHMDQFSEMLKKLWTTWPNIEKICLVGIKDEAIWRNLDEIFTGIPLLTVESLRETKDFENFECYLPTFGDRRSIRYLKKLKMLRLELLHDPLTCKLADKATSDIFMTEVTAKCAFAVMPELKVEISRNRCDVPNCHVALECLEGFVSFLPRVEGILPPGWELE